MLSAVVPPIALPEEPEFGGLVPFYNPTKLLRYGGDVTQHCTLPLSMPLNTARVFFQLYPTFQRFDCKVF
jgi:hypothetical protein